MNSQALRLSALVAAAMSAGYLWRAALDGEAPQRVLAGVPSELRSELGQTPFSSLSLIRPGSAQAAAPAEGTTGASSETSSAPTAAFVRLVSFAPPAIRHPRRGPGSASRSQGHGSGKS